MPNGARTSNGAHGKDSYAVRPNYRSLAVIGWADISDDIISQLVATVTSNGAAVMFGVTSDGGALSLCVLDQNSKLKEYPRSETEVHNFSLWLKDEYFSQPPLIPIKK